MQRFVSELNLFYQEKVCEESTSFDLTSLDFAHCIDEVGDLLKAVTKMTDAGVVSEGHEGGESSGKVIAELTIKKRFITESFGGETTRY